MDRRGVQNRIWRLSNGQSKREIEAYRIWRHQLSRPAQFSVQSTEELNKIVNDGTVSFEYRPFLVHGIQDIPGFLLAQCSGPEAFFPLTEQLYAEQAIWLGKLSTVTEADQQAMQKMAPEQIATLLGTKMGLIEFCEVTRYQRRPSQIMPVG